MPDTKITALAAITTVDPAADVLPIVDISDTSMAASGTTKKITSNQILGAGGTATLASATISGAASAAGLSVTGSTIPTNGVYLPSANNLGFAYNSTLGMTLNATGLGVGTSPSYKLHVFGASPALTIQDSSSAAGGVGGTINFIAYTSGTSGANIEAQIKGVKSSASSAGELLFFTSDSSGISQQRFMVDGTGNLGIGVTPSAWVSSSKAIDIAAWAGVGYIASSAATVITNNTYKDAASNWVFKNGSNAAGYFEIAQNLYRWWQAPAAGGAGTTAAMVQAMTLDTSGNLLVGTTTNGGNGVSIRPSTSSPNVVLVGSDTSGGTAWQLYSTGTSSNRFYVTWAGVVNAVNTTISGISDARLKENVQDIDVGLGAILALKPRKFDWKAGKGKDIKGDRGFIAQEFEQVFPQLVDEWADPAPEGEAPYKSVRQDLIPVLVKAIQELAAEVNALKNA